MSPTLGNLIAVWLQLAIVLVAGAVYFIRVALPRPPVGVYNLKDIAFLVVIIVILPPLYLRLPAIVMVLMVGLAFLVVIRQALAPVLPGRLPLLLALALLAADIALSQLHGRNGPHPAFMAMNNLAIAVAVVGACNLYAQSGMRAREVAVLGMALSIYDYVATIALPTMVEFVARLADQPLVPMIGWGDNRTGFALGLGDTLMLLLWTLVAWKGFGKKAGVLAAVTGLLAVTVMMAVMWAGLVTRALPAMVILGPLFGLEYLAWRRRHGGERTVQAYRQGPPASPEAATAEQLRAALQGLWEHREALQQAHAGQHVAVWENNVLGAGASRGEARRAARRARPEIVPIITYIAPVLNGQGTRTPLPQGTLER